MTYPSDSPLPPVLKPCRWGTAFTFDTSSAAFVFDTGDSNLYAGPVRVSGTGLGDCESASLGSGAMTLTLQGQNETTQTSISCPKLRATSPERSRT
jgi:hypothetical protein